METIGKTINRNLAEYVDRVLQCAKPNCKESLGQAKLSALFMDCCKQVCPAFRVDGETRDLMNELFLYAIGQSCKLDQRKGLWIYGNVGTGKSTLLRALRAFDLVTGGNDDRSGRPCGGFRIEAASTVANRFVTDGLGGIAGCCNGALTCAFDEVGREPLPVRYYGTEVNVMQYVFQMRYDFRHSSRTHVTTNMLPEEIPFRYGDYIADRVNEMFNVIELRGESKR